MFLVNENGPKSLCFLNSWTYTKKIESNFHLLKATWTYFIFLKKLLQKKTSYKSKHEKLLR